MAGVNLCTFIGNAGRDPESRSVNGKTVCSFSLAVNERKDGDTLWITVECWDKLADVVQRYVSKGKQVYVSGRLKVRKYTKKDTGEEKQAVELVANTVQFLGGAGDGAGKGGGKKASEKSVQEKVTGAFGDQTEFADSVADDDSVPF